MGMSTRRLNALARIFQTKVDRRPRPMSETERIHQEIARMTSGERRARLTFLILKMQFGRAPTLVEVQSVSPGFLEDHGRKCKIQRIAEHEAAGRHDEAEKIRDSMITWQEELARELEHQDPSRAARLRARNAPED